MAVALQHPFKVGVFRLLAVDRPPPGMCLISSSTFRPGVLFSRTAGLVFGALLARSLLSEVSPSGTQGVQGLLGKDCGVGGTI